MELDVRLSQILLLVGAMVAIVARRLRLPYTVGLVVAGVALSFVPPAGSAPLSKELIFTVFLPPLVFEAAFLLRWQELRRDLAPILTLATLGIFIAVAVVTGGLVTLLGWDWRAALLFGVLISATDPVSVIAMFKESKSTGRVRLLVEAESLFNDGTAAALFAVALAAGQSDSVSGWSALSSFSVISLGGLGIGVAVGWICVFLMGRTEDYLVEITLSAVAAFSSFLLAEGLGVSGVLATLAAGLLVGNFGPLQGLSSKGRDDAETFWEFAAFVANTLVFLLIGIRLATQAYLQEWKAVIAAIVLVLAGRAIAVFLLTSFWSKGPRRIEASHKKVLVWGGLRGALALGLALAVPPDYPQHDKIVAVAFAVVAFSVLVQGLTVKPLIHQAVQHEG